MSETELSHPNMIKSIFSDDDYRYVYSLLDTSPLEFDCGDLCGKRCCQEYQPGVGMYLLPGEEKLFTGQEPWLKWSLKRAEDQDFPPDWKGYVAFVECNSNCPREKRPVQCRTFPLMPYIDLRGNLTVRLDVLNGPFLCPLVRYPRKYPLRDEFRQRVLEAWRILVTDPLIRSDVLWQSRNLDRDIRSPWRKLFQRVTFFRPPERR
ncbi:MAG TPA: hypothetical protein GX510_04200 [Firmicutes bacterium]|nr:hypothetical protein [Candidatus Fermentithermobacillaceae bacterium]